MRIELQASGLELDPTLRNYVEQRVRRSLGRFQRHVERVRVRLTDVNGPKGGDTDIRCKVRADIKPRGELTITEANADPGRATSRAVDRLRRNLGRRLDRLRTSRRRPHPVPIDV